MWLRYDQTHKSYKSHNAGQRPVAAVTSQRMDNSVIESQDSRLSRESGSCVRRLFTSKQLYESLQPLFFVTFLHGLTPFYISGDGAGNKKLKLSIFGYLYGLIHIVIYGSCYTLTLLNSCETVSGYIFHSRVSRFTDFMQILSGLIGITVIYLSAIIPKHRLQHSLKTVQLIDTKMRNIGVKIMYNFLLRYCYFNMVIMFLVDFIYTFGNFSLLKSANLKPSLPLYVVFTLQHSVISFAIALFSCITKLLEMRLMMIHKVLKNLEHQWDNRIVKNISQKQRSLQCLDSFSMYTIVTKDPCEIIQESMEIHHMICDAASTANKYFTYQLLTIISIAFLIIVFDAYYVLETLLGKSKRESKFKTIEFVTFFSCQMVLYLIAIISIVEGSNRAIKKSEKTGGIVHSLLNKAKSADVKEKLQQFSMQLLHLKINFTAAGLFNIDRTLYFTISGALTTYLIILLQFTSSAPPPQPDVSHMSLGTAEGTGMLNYTANITLNN